MIVKLLATLGCAAAFLSPGLVWAPSAGEGARAADWPPAPPAWPDGSYRAMRTSYVDESWAKEHHEYWYDDVKSGKRPAGGALPTGAHLMKEKP